MKLAIIIPTYDSLDTLKVLVKTVYANTKEFNLYIVEDGQNKKTISWLKKLKRPNLKVIYHEKNKGIAPSWNDGVKEALKDNCDYFAIFNDDIEVPPNWWKDCQKVFTGRIHLLGLTAPCPIPLTGWFFIIDKYCVEKAGLFDESFVPYMSEDSEYYYRCREIGIGFAKINIKVFHHGSTTINKVAKKDMVEFKRICGENWQRLRNKYPYVRFQA